MKAKQRARERPQSILDRLARRHRRRGPRWYVHGGCCRGRCSERMYQAGRDDHVRFWLWLRARDAMRALAPFAPRVVGALAALARAWHPEIELAVVAPDPRAVLAVVRALGWSHEVTRGWRPTDDVPHPALTITVEAPAPLTIRVYREAPSDAERAAAPWLDEAGVTARMRSAHRHWFRDYGEVAPWNPPPALAWTPAAPGTLPAYDPLPGYEDA